MIVSDGDSDSTTTFGVIETAEIGHEFFTSPVHIHITGRAFETLMNEPVQERSAVVAEGRRRKRVLLKFVTILRSLGRGRERRMSVG